MRVLPSISYPVEVQSRYFTEKKVEKRFSAKTLFAVGLGSLILLSLSFALVLSLFGLKYAILMLALLVAVPTVGVIVGNPRAGIIILLVSAYFLMWIYRMGIDFALGTLMDGMYALLIFGFFLNQKFRPNWKIFKTPLAIIILIWVGYLVLQVGNPNAESQLAWIFNIRSWAVVALLYFVFSYYISTLSFVRTILNLWMFLSFLGALNAFKQEHFGFFAFEEATFNDPLVQALLFINGTWRKFSIFSDPVAFSYNMAISTIFCICVLTSPNTKKKKALYFFLGCFFTTTMLYSATRASYVLLPGALILYIIMNLNRRVLAFGIVGAAFMFVLINIPTGNVTLYRFQSAFKPSDDASYKVRKNNQKKIQPYIQSHPFGGGLGSTGASGVRFAPYSFLAQLPPDSGYFRVAVELGWIGLIIFCSMFFIALRQGILNYYQIKDPELKSYCLAMTLIVFALNIGSFPQEALVQFPISIYFFLFLALINITLKLDKEKQLQEVENQKSLLSC
jgi:hypothetical protein